MSSRYEHWAGRVVRRDDGGRFADDDTSRFLTHARDWLGKVSAQFTVEHHDRWGDPDPETSRRFSRSGPPRAKQLGYFRVADHPAHEGTADRSTASYARTFPTSTHPDAGGLWVDPDRPGTRHSPRFFNDFGVPVSGLAPPVSRTQRFRESGRPMAEFTRTPEGDQVDVVTRRRGQERTGPLGSRGNPEDFKLPWISPQVWKRIMQAKGKAKRSRTWIEKLNIRMQRGEA